MIEFWSNIIQGLKKVIYVILLKLRTPHQAAHHTIYVSPLCILDKQIL